MVLGREAKFAAWGASPLQPSPVSSSLDNTRELFRLSVSVFASPGEREGRIGSRNITLKINSRPDNGIQKEAPPQRSLAWGPPCVERI